MYPPHIQEAAAAMGRTLTESATPLYACRTAGRSSSW